MYKFTRTPDPTNDTDCTTITMKNSNNDATYRQLLEDFEAFLKACGFVFNGHVVMEDPEETE